MHLIITNSKDNQCQRTNTLISVERNAPVQDEPFDTPTVTRDIRLLWSSTSTVSMALTPRMLQTFGSGAVTTYFFDLGLSRLGLDPPNLPLVG